MLKRTRDRISLLEDALDAAERRAEREADERAANWLDSKTTRRVVVQVNAGPGEADSIEGVLSLVSPDGVVLVNAVFLDAGGARVEMGGEVWLPRPKVRIVQTLPTTEG